MIKVRIIKILCTLIFGVFIMGMGFEIRPFASDGIVVDAKNYELSCHDIEVDINEFHQWDYQTLIKQAGCQLLADQEVISTAYLYVNGEDIQKIDQPGTYEFTIGVDDKTAVRVKVELFNELKQDSPEVSPDQQEIVDQLPQDILYLNGKSYHIDSVQDHELFGQIIRFSSNKHEYIGLKAWGIYFKAKPNYLFLAMTVMSLVAVALYIYFQANDQREYWGYRGERK
ncbi:MAG: hypothetical protein MR210_09685 [Erysipelotrichaceae bacterium]|nr:hypothetical protein [Erysipelotrichaceae bacterium]MDY5251525.1 hypothetical protein [Erysipelotrichaceae bacterium]